VEIPLNECSTFTIGRVNQSLRIALGIAFGDKTPYFFFSGSVQKEAQSVIADPQELLRSSSHDDTIPRSRGLFDHLLRDSDDTVSVQALYGRARTTLIASKRERAEQTVVKRVAALFTCLKSLPLNWVGNLGTSC
jgi:hypothetical protein